MLPHHLIEYAQCVYLKGGSNGKGESIHCRRPERVG
jgi:hypothetical protein